jgi:hypothetical protein
MRPTKLTPALTARIVGHVLSGFTLRGTAAAAGIGERTLHDWLKGFPQFSQSIRNAQTQALRTSAADMAARRLVLGNATALELQGVRNGFAEGHTISETVLRLGISRTTEWRHRSVLKLMAGSKAAKLERADAELRVVRSLLAAYADGFKVAPSDPRWEWALYLGLEISHGTGRRDTKAKLEVRP